MARSTRTKRRIVDDDDPDDEEERNEEEEEDNRNIVEGNADNDKKEAVDEASATKQSSSSLADRQKKRMLDKLAKAAGGSTSRSNSPMPKKQKKEEAKEVKPSTPAIPKKKNVATDDNPNKDGGESGPGDDGQPSSLLAGMGLKPVPSLQQQKYQQRRPPSAATAAGRGSGPTTTTGRPYPRDGSDDWKRRERPTTSRSPNRDRPGGTFPPVPHGSSTAVTTVAGVVPQQNDSSTPQNNTTSTATNHNNNTTTKNPQKIKSEVMIMKALGELCQEMKQNISRARGISGGIGSNHDTFGLGSRSMGGGDAPAVDLSGSFLRSKVVNDQDKYDFFDLDDDGGIVLQPTIPMFPEDFPPGQKEWPLSWWGIVDPALADADRDAKRIKAKDQKKNLNEPDDGRNRRDGGGIGGTHPPRNQDRQPFYSREDSERYNRSSRSRDRYDQLSTQYQRQYPPFQGPGNRGGLAWPGPEGRRGGPNGGGLRPQHPLDHGGPPDHMQGNHGADFRGGGPPATYGPGQHYGPGQRGGRAGGGRGRGRGGPPAGWSQHPNHFQPVGGFRGGRGGGGRPVPFGDRPPPPQQQYRGREDRDRR